MISGHKNTKYWMLIFTCWFFPINSDNYKINSNNFNEMHLCVWTYSSVKRILPPQKWMKISLLCDCDYAYILSFLFNHAVLKIKVLNYCRYAKTVRSYGIYKKSTDANNETEKNELCVGRKVRPFVVVSQY